MISYFNFFPEMMLRGTEKERESVCGRESLCVKERERECMGGEIDSPDLCNHEREGERKERERGRERKERERGRERERDQAGLETRNAVVHK